MSASLIQARLRLRAWVQNVRPEFVSRVDAAIAALRAGESRNAVIAVHGSIVVRQAEEDLRR